MSDSRSWTAEHMEAMQNSAPNGAMREFETGATRNVDHNKLDFEGFYHPSVMKRFAEYMHKNRHQADGKLRDSDNWQKGIPQDAYMKSGFRHFFEWWEIHRTGGATDETERALEEALCALLFNVQGYLFEYLKRKRHRGAQEVSPSFPPPGSSLQGSPCSRMEY